MLCIWLAVMVGLASLLLPYADGYRPEIEQWLGQRLGRVVTLQRVEAEWTVTGPLLTLHGLAIRDPETQQAGLTVDMANVGFDVYGWLRPGRGGMSYFRLLSDRVELTRDENGNWGLSGFGQATGGDPRSTTSWILEQGSISALAREFVITDQARQRSLTLNDVSFSLNNLGDFHQLTSSVESPDGASQLEFMLEVTSKPQQADASALQFHVVGEQIDLPRWLGDFPVAGARLLDGNASLELWGSWDGVSVFDLTGSVAVDHLKMAGARGLTLDAQERVDTRYALDRFSSHIDLQVQVDQRWELQLDQFELERAGHHWSAGQMAFAQKRDNPNGPMEFAALADFFRIQDISNALVVFESLPEDFRRSLYLAAPHGNLRSIVLDSVYPGWPLVASGSLQFDQLSLQSTGRVPGLAGLSGKLILDGDKGRIQLTTENAFVSIPGVFRSSLPIAAATGTLHWRRVAEQWELDFPDLSLETVGVRAAGRFLMRLGDATKPFLDINMQVRGGAIENASRFWPINKFKPKLITWLDRALVGGELRSGAVVLYGDMDDWPFLGHQGRFEAQADIEQALLDYHPDWPPLYELNSHLEFNALGMQAWSNGAEIAGIAVESIEANLPRFSAPRVELQVNGRGAGETLLNFLRESPIQVDYGDYLDGLSIDGSGEVWLDLELPVRKGLGQKKVLGQVWLEDTRIDDERWNLTFEHTNGRIDYTDKGFEAVGLDTVFRGFQATLSMRAGGFVQNPAAVAEGKLVGVAKVGTILSDFPVLRPILERVPSASVWTAELSVSPEGQLLIDGSLPEVSPRLVLESTLEGTAVELPGPFEKAPGEAMPVSIAVELPEVAKNLTLTIGELASLVVRQDSSDGAWYGTALFGPGQAQFHDEVEGLVIEGQMDFFNLDQWRVLASEMLAGQIPGGGQEWVRSASLQVGVMRFLGRDFSNLSIEMTRDADYWNILLSGDQVQGRVRLPLALHDNRLILAEFERLQWADSVAGVPAAGMLPAEFPPLRFFAKDLIFLGFPMGTVNFETYPTSNGMHIERISTQSDTLAIQANGDWFILYDDFHSRFAATVTGEDLGDILELFKFEGGIIGGQTLVKLDVNWLGSPADFEWDQLAGDLDINIGSGQIIEVDPGAGRLVGLLSLRSLPRRLLLDFSDLFKAGLAFDSIIGNFELEKGDAYTDNIVIKGPTAEVRMDGRTGLAQEDYNQIITVIPKVGDALPLVGALAGGGAGAAAFLLLDGIFGKQIDEITQYHYSVTGSWDDPDIELLGADSAQVAIDVPSPRGGG
jgi:uncharacterized protein (TIGR02099 family)